MLGRASGEAPPLFTNAPPKTRTGPVRIGGRVAEANLMQQVQPTYPPLAKSARVQGAVKFTAIISKDGKIENLQLIRGHPLLVNAAKDAVLQWRYRPTLLNGRPVEVVTDIVVNFTLNP
jgi:periplasmic protein TonB